MGYKKDRGGERAPDRSPDAADSSSGQRQRVWRPVKGTQWLLLILFVELQIADVVTTNYALAVPGNWEANPIMAFYQARWGAAWWLPKAAAAGWVCVAALLIRRRWPMIFAVSYYVLVVAGNLALL